MLDRFNPLHRRTDGDEFREVYDSVRYWLTEKAEDEGNFDSEV